MPSEKTLKRIVIILGVLLVAGFLTVVGTIIYRLSIPDGSKQTGAEISADDLIMSTPENPVRLVRYGKNDKISIFIFENKRGEQSVMIVDNQTREVLGHIPMDGLDEDLSKPAEEN